MIISVVRIKNYGRSLSSSLLLLGVVVVVGCGEATGDLPLIAPLRFVLRFVANRERSSDCSIQID
jgi:hypothetical protein